MIETMSLFSRLRSLGAASASIPDEPAVYRPIGAVRNRVRRPKIDGWQDVKSDLVLREDLADALDGIEGFSHVIVVFHLDRVPDEEKRLRVPVGSGPEVGVLATRSQLRPNAIGVAVVPLLRRRGPVLRVQGLDALDGTPLLDVKPYLPPYDAVPAGTLPSWAVAEADAGD
jgi:tRNA-Thr(GGU) m(6)t(6)A37 methyltransferase TsaA